MKKIILVFLISLILVIPYYGLAESNEVVEIKLVGNLNLYEPRLNLSSYSISPSEIESVSIVTLNKSRPVGYRIVRNEIYLQLTQPLPMNEAVEVHLSLKSDKLIILTGITGDLPIINESGKVASSKTLICTGLNYNNGIKGVDKDSCAFIIVPASPKKGFNFPYMLFLPDGIRQSNSALSLIVEPNNNTDASYENYESFFYKQQKQIIGTSGFQVATKMKVPFMTPIFPNLGVFFTGIEDQYLNSKDHEIDMFATQSLDRSSILLDEEQVKRYYEKATFVSQWEEHGLTKEDLGNLVRVDKQLVAMIKHAKSYLVKNQFDLKEKVLMTGFSSSGNFSNRFAMLYPELVQAVASGGINSTPMLPQASINGRNLIYPVGTHDYQKITGKPFNLNDYNNVAVYNYQGKLDLNDTIGYKDVFGPEETSLIKDLMGVKMYPDRWTKSIQLFREGGGKSAVFADYDGIGHEINDLIISDIVSHFIKSLGINNDVKANVVPVRTFSLSDGDVTLMEGATKQLKVIIEPSNATDKRLRWISSNPDVVSVDQLGLVKALKPGSAQISVITIDGGITGYCKFEVVASERFTDSQRLSMDKNKLVVGFGKGDRASAVTGKIILPTSGAQGSIISWKSMKPKIISNLGFVTRPTKGGGNVSVELVATLKIGNAVSTKSFKVIVLARK